MGPLKVLAAVSAALAAAAAPPSLDLLDSLGQNTNDNSGNAPPAALMLMELSSPSLPPGSATAPLPPPAPDVPPP
jgi:hypothetical protein